MKAAKLRELSQAELETQVHDWENQLWKLRFQLSTGQTEAVKNLRAIRKDLARAKTLLRERELRTGHGE